MAFRREKKRIGDMLINENVITQEQLEKALPIAKEKHKKIGETLILRHPEKEATTVLRFRLSSCRMV